ncbi:MAG: hypothetical protein ABH826_01910 [Patescibacteria group bacterium]
MTHPDDIMSTEELAIEITTEIQALGINIEYSLAIVKVLLSGILICAIIALIHFW